MLLLALLATLHGSLDFIDDDYPKALAIARARHKPLFIDFWATWCHSCLSMQRFVLSDPGMAPVQDLAVFAAIETETEKNKPVVEQYPLDAWPTFLIVDPVSEKVLGRWIGSGSVQELRAFVQDAAAQGKTDEASLAQRAGDAARIAGHLREAADAYGRAVQLSQAKDPQRPERLNLYLSALHKLKAAKICVETALREAPAMPATAVGADFISYGADCADQLAKDDPLAAAMRKLALARLREILDSKGAPLSADDRSDALANLSGLLEESGQHDKAQDAMRERAAVLEKAAAQAPDATMASTFDAHRADTYLALGDAPKAEALLAQREKEMPSDYNPPARLARVLFQEKKLAPAEDAVDRALAKMDRGQRRVGILELKKEILAAEKKPVAAVLREELEVLRGLPKTQRKPQREAELEAQLR